MNEMMIQTMNFGVPMIYMWLLMILAIALYFMPTIVAGYRHHSSLFLIVVLNILFGWTMLGWLLLLVWACFGDQYSTWSRPAEKKCPYCAEYIKSEAIKCKHCGSDLTKTAA
jgi:hypothetical protein